MSLHLLKWQYKACERHQAGISLAKHTHISPFLGLTTAGITSLWARTTTWKYECVVTVGYPEKVEIIPKWAVSPEYYNSAIIDNAEGETIASYRKSFFYYADETWALEGPDGFFDGEIDGRGNVAMGGMHGFKSAREFAYRILHKKANLRILSMAWLTGDDARANFRTPKELDMDTLSYWLARMEPLIKAETVGQIIYVFANRCGTEEEALYTGTIAVLGIHGGEVKVYGILGRGESELLVVDTNKRPQSKLVPMPVKNTKRSTKDKESKGDHHAKEGVESPTGKGSRSSGSPKDKNRCIEEDSKGDRESHKDKEARSPSSRKDRASHEDKEPRSPDSRKDRALPHRDKWGGGESRTKTIARIQDLLIVGRKESHSKINARDLLTPGRVLRRVGKESDLLEPRTNSTASEESIKSSTNGLSIETEASPPGPSTLVAMDLGSLSAIDKRIERIEGITMDDIVTSLPPVDANSPSTFFSPFGRTPEGTILRGTLKSTIGLHEFGAAQSNSPIFVRPASPKPRN